MVKAPRESWQGTREIGPPHLLEPRVRTDGPIVFRRGAHPPFAIRWFGITSLFGHLRHFAASAIAAESIDARDWMRPQAPKELLEGVLRILGGNPDAPTLLEGISEPVWIDFIADTGDDRDVSVGVARMLFAHYRVGREGDSRMLPRGQILLFGGDTAYPVATADEIHKRVVSPWNDVLRPAEAEDDPPRVLIGIPGNHDWYDGLDGFARLFRKGYELPSSEAPNVASARKPIALRTGRKTGFVVRQLHLDEVGTAVGLLANLVKSVRAFWRGSSVARRKRLTLHGYKAVQESSYWVLPLAPGLDIFGVDRQLGRLDFRQRMFFYQRRDEHPRNAVLFVAPDPALAFGERWDLGARMLTASALSFHDNRIFYLTGDMHHYERREVGASLHVIAGGGGAFLHGTRILPGPGGPPKAAYPDSEMCRRLIAQVPLRLMVGGAGFMVHMGFAVVAAIEIVASRYGLVPRICAAVGISIALAIAFYINAGHKRAHPRQVAVVAVPFGVGLGLSPILLRLALPQLIPALASDSAVILAYAFLGALVFGLFLMVLVLTGLEHQQAYAVLGHPGFKHFVRLCVHPDGKIEAWCIGKDDPISSGPPHLIDSFVWDGARKRNSSA